MRKVTIEIIEDDDGIVSVKETRPPRQECSRTFNNAEVVGLLTQFIQNKIARLCGLPVENGGGN